MVAVDDDTAGSTVADAVDIDDTAAAVVDIVADPMIGKADFVAPDSNSLIADYYYLYIAVTEFGHPIAIVARHHLAMNCYLFH